MDQVSAFQVFSTLKKLKPSKQKKVKRLKKKNQNTTVKNVKEKIENALQDLDLVQNRATTSKQNKDKKKAKGNKKAKLKSSNNHAAKRNNDSSVNTEAELNNATKCSQPKASNTCRQNPSRSSVHEKSGKKINSSCNGNVSCSKLNVGSDTLNPENSKKGNKSVSKLVETQEVKENKLNKEAKKTTEKSVEGVTWLKNVLALAEKSSSSNNSEESMEFELESSSDINESDDFNLSEAEEVFDEHTIPFKESQNALNFMLHPMNIDMFFEKFWEKTPVLIKGNPKKFFTKGKPLVTTSMIDEVLRKHNIQFTKNLDITTYTNGVRETHNPEGRAYPSVVWDYYLNDCSIRMLNPQSYIPSLHLLNSTLQEYFTCFVGANLYLTPPNSQGFAPHYDDIEAFILQVEGQKRWRLYKPRCKDEVMPRYSSRNFTDAEIGEPFMDVILEQGDLLYFPRGTIHQGETVDGKHSLHVTLSVYQKNSWADFLEKLIPIAMKNTIENNARFRTGMPLGYLKDIGTAYQDKSSRTRKTVVSVARSFMKKMLMYLNVDQAADEMAKNCVHDFLPPVLNSNEAKCSILEDGEQMMEDGKTSGQVEIEPDTMIRLVRHHCAKLIKDPEDNVYKLLYSTENSKVYHEYELQYLEIGEEFLLGIKQIINTYPAFVRVEDLMVNGLDLKIQLAKDLWEKCLVITKEPLQIFD